MPERNKRGKICFGSQGSVFWNPGSSLGSHVLGQKIMEAGMCGKGCSLLLCGWEIERGRHTGRHQCDIHLYPQGHPSELLPLTWPPTFCYLPIMLFYYESFKEWIHSLGPNLHDLIVSGNTNTVTPRRALPNLLDMSYVFTLFICVLYVCACSKACMGVSEDSWRRGVSFFHHVGPENGVWVIRLSSNTWATESTQWSSLGTFKYNQVS